MNFYADNNLNKSDFLVTLIMNDKKKNIGTVKGYPSLYLSFKKNAFYFDFKDIHKEKSFRVPKMHSFISKKTSQCDLEFKCSLRNIKFLITFKTEESCISFQEIFQRHLKLSNLSRKISFTKWD